MRRVIEIIKRYDMKKAQKQGLELETDYMLATLYQAMEENDNKEREKCIARLFEIQDELKELQA